MSRASDEAFSSNFYANRKILRDFKINDNVVITYEGSSPLLGTVIGYETFDNDGRITLMVRIITYSRLRESDSMPVWAVDPLKTQAEVV